MQQSPVQAPPSPGKAGRLFFRPDPPAIGGAEAPSQPTIPAVKDPASESESRPSVDSMRSTSCSDQRGLGNHHASEEDHPNGIDRIGDLSCGENEFDFAILLKPSKYEESLDLHADPATAPSAYDAVQIEPQTSEQLGLSLNARAESKQQLSGKRQPHDPARARNLIIQRITHTGLQVKRLLSMDGKQTLLKVKAPQHVLEIGAEHMGMRKLRKFDQIWMEFSCELRTTFADFDASIDGVRFIDSEKQSIVHALLTTDGIGAGLNEFCPLKSKYVVQMFPLHKDEDLAFLRRQWVTYWRLPLASDAADASNPTGSKRSSSHSPQTCGGSTNTCVGRVVRQALTQPIDQVAQYFGEKIAFYFAWMELYTRWLLVPSVVGLLVFISQVQRKTLDDPVAPWYAIFMALWTSAFLIAWKRRASTLAYRWGTLGYEDVEIARPEFYGDPALSDATTKRYPAWKRYLKYLVTIPCVFVSIAVVVALTYLAFTTRDRLEQKSIEVKARAAALAKEVVAELHHGLTLENLKQLSSIGLSWDFWFYFLVTPMLYGLLIPVLDEIFTKLARAMNNWENHPTETRYQSHLILKVFSFRFVHVFASLYYYAFANSSRRDNLVRVAVQLASFMVAGQLWTNVMETLMPFLKRKLQVQRKKRATNAQFQRSNVFNVMAPRRGGGGRMAMASVEMINNNALIHEQCVRLEQASDKAWEEAELDRYDTFEDYTEMLIQIGYVSFFSLAFPLAPLLALANNLVVLRTDAFKLCHAKQRPIAHKASGIGIWFQVLQFMSVVAVLTNCLHIAFTTTQIESLFPGISLTAKVWVVFALEHLLLALKVWLMFVIPSMPAQVKANVQREREHVQQESARAMALRMQVDDCGSHELQASSSSDSVGLRQRNTAAEEV